MWLFIFWVLNFQQGDILDASSRVLAWIFPLGVLMWMFPLGMLAGMLLGGVSRVLPLRVLAWMLPLGVLAWIASSWGTSMDASFVGD